MEVNPNLGLKQKICPIIIHWVAITFNPWSRSHIHKLISDNHGELDTATNIIWAYKYLIESGEPFLSLIVDLTDPVAEHLEISNRVCYKHLLKVTKRSTHRVKQ